MPEDYRMRVEAELDLLVRAEEAAAEARESVLEQSVNGTPRS